MNTLTTTNPATNKTIKDYSVMTDSEVNSILTTMHTQQQAWQTTAFSERAKLMKNVANELRTSADNYAQLITEEMGKPITQAKGEIEKCAILCEHYAEHAERYLQPQRIKTEKTNSYVCYQPLGIIYAVMPWNFPFWQVLRFAVPNLMAGNAGVLKHSENVTGAALAVEQLFIKAGFPEGLFRSLIIEIKQSPKVIQHPLVKAVTLTGSERAGKAITADASPVLKKVVMELGGSDPYLILEDADLDLAAEQCVKSRLNNAGQVCISAKRIIVHESVKAAFIEKLLPLVKQYQCGDPRLDTTTLGPMARDDLRDALHKQVEASVAAGAECILEGGPKDGPGNFYAPVVLANVKKGTPAYDEELFGPVICILDAKDEAEAIQIANDTPYGLGAAVFTKDTQRGERIAREALQAGTCNVNCLVGSDPRLPFGGIKLSGYGRELSAEGIREFMNVKTVNVA